jgi:hypothetical protein
MYGNKGEIGSRGCRVGGGRTISTKETRSPANCRDHPDSGLLLTGRSLLEERKLVDANNVYEATLRELLRALPESNPDVAIVQPEAEFNSITLGENGVLTIDWKQEILDFEAEPKEERLAFASLLMTFGGFEEVEKLRFTVEGKESGTIGGKDITAFWGEVSLKDQPYAVMRPPTQTPKGEILEEQLNGPQENTATE